MMKVMVVMTILTVASLIFAVQGVIMHYKVSGEEAKFHSLQDTYWNTDKATRDAAPANSQLNQDLVKIKNFPSELLRLKLVGVGKMLTGIYILLFGILMALVMMPSRLGKIIMQGKK